MSKEVLINDLIEAEEKSFEGIMGDIKKEMEQYKKFIADPTNKELFLELLARARVSKNNTAYASEWRYWEYDIARQLERIGYVELLPEKWYHIFMGTPYRLTEKGVKFLDTIKRK